MLDNRIRIKDDLSRLLLRATCDKMKHMDSSRALLQLGQQAHCTGWEAGLPSDLDSITFSVTYGPTSKKCKRILWILPLFPNHSPKATKIIRFLQCILPEEFHASESKLCVHMFFPPHFPVCIQMGVYYSQVFCTSFPPPIFISLCWRFLHISMIIFF